jgi:hypothetical protein
MIKQGGEWWLRHDGIGKAYFKYDGEGHQEEEQ